jgi:hypothetical protein
MDNNWECTSKEAYVVKSQRPVPWPCFFRLFINPPFVFYYTSTLVPTQVKDRLFLSTGSTDKRTYAHRSSVSKAITSSLGNHEVPIDQSNQTCEQVLGT